MPSVKGSLTTLKCSTQPGALNSERIRFCFVLFFVARYTGTCCTCSFPIQSRAENRKVPVPSWVPTVCQSVMFLAFVPGWILEPFPRVHESKRVLVHLWFSLWYWLDHLLFLALYSGFISQRSVGFSFDKRCVFSWVTYQHQ